jgi:serine/threonine-protein kinase
MTDDASTSDAPTVVAGRYEILGLLGAGGMGRVYRAKDRELSEIVALKMLHPDVASDEIVERFRQEVRLARRVTHKNVARTFDIGQHGTEKFLTMELVTGESLATRLERGLMPLDETLGVARAILAGMSAAHAVGVVHRDLKPDNVLLETGGRVVITDFGIARADVAGEASKTGGGIIGTPAYMAPEQVGGGVAIDARADIYAFGAILYEMVTGRRAWPGDSALAVATARLVEPPPDPRAARPALETALAEVILKCLARDRDARYAKDEDVERALAAALVTDSASATISLAGKAPDKPRVFEDRRARTVAVAPFRNLGPPDDAYFAEGLTEDLTDVLMTVRGLRVRGRAAAEASDRDVVDMGRRLGVDVVADGSVRRAGDTMRVNARLISVADGFQLWSARFDRRAGDAFAINDEVSRAIASALAAEHNASPRPQPTDPAAIDLYFRARKAVYLEHLDEAAALFRDALARAPDDPTILAGHALVRTGRNFFAPLSPDETRALVRRALEVGGALADPWVALAALRFHDDDDAPGAIRASRRALDIAPSSADAHDRAGRILLEANEWDDALFHLERALWLDPQQRWARFDRMRAAALVSDWAKAGALLDEGPPDWSGHRVWQCTRIWSFPGAPARAFEVPADAGRQFHDLHDQYMRARAHRDGAATYALDDLRAAVTATMGAQATGRVRRFFAQVGAEQAAICGHFEGALDFVGEAVDVGFLDVAWMDRFTLLDPLRAEPRFQTLRAAVAERAARVRAAWRDPPEAVEHAIASLTSR